MTAFENIIYTAEHAWYYLELGRYLNIQVDISQYSLSRYGIDMHAKVKVHVSF